MTIPLATLRSMRASWVSSVIVVVAAAVLTIVIGTGSDEPESPAAVPAVDAVDASPVAGEFVEFVSPDHGFALAYPSDWQVLEVADEQVLLVATPNGRDSLLVRAVPAQVTVENVDDLPAAQAVTDEIVGPGVEVLIGPQPIELDGLPGLFYLYRFQDELSGATGAHSHYFVFHGDTMIVIVLQALPVEGFDQLAPIFDRIIMSFRSL